MQSRGSKLFIAFAACPTGWGFDPSQSHHIAWLAVDTGVWLLKEAIRGEVRHTFIPDWPRPVVEYLEPQPRFRHLFHPIRQEVAIDDIQRHVDEYWSRVRAAEPIKVAG